MYLLSNLNPDEATTELLKVYLMFSLQMKVLLNPVKQVQNVQNIQRTSFEFYFCFNFIAILGRIVLFWLSLSGAPWILGKIWKN